MARIYKLSDRIKVKIDDVTVKLAPLSLDQKTEIQQAMIEGRVSKDLKAATLGLVLAVKYSIKAIEGVETADGSPYQLTFENGMLTDESIDDLMNLEVTGKMALICASLVKGVPKAFTDEKMNPLDGVEILAIEKADDEKNA